MVIYRPEHLLGRYEETGHLPDRHFEIHLGEFKESLEKSQCKPSASISLSVRRCKHGVASIVGVSSSSSLLILPPGTRCHGTHLLKNRGIRSPSDRPAGVAAPKLGVPPCWRGIDM